MVAATIESEPIIFFKYGVAYYNPQELSMWFTNEGEKLYDFLVQVGGAIKTVQTFQNQEEFENFKKEIEKLNKWQKEQNQKSWEL